jgi:hypothetical protein
MNEWIDIVRAEGPLRVNGFDVENRSTDALRVRLVRSSGAVIVDIVTGQRGMAILPRDDLNEPLWDTLEPIYVPVDQSVTLQATTRVSGMILVGGKIAAISEV